MMAAKKPARIVTTEDGAQCPACGGFNLRVTKTRRRGAKVRRFRECKDCGEAAARGLRQ